MNKGCLILLSLSLLFVNSYRTILLDHGSFISRDMALKKFVHGMALLNDEPIKSYEHFRSSVTLYPNYVALENALIILELLGRNKSFVTMDTHESLDSRLHHIQSLILRGREQNSNGNFANAIHYFDEVLNEYPFHPEALFLKGSSLERLGEVDIAVQYCTRTLDVNPIYTKALLNLGSILQKYGQVEESIVLYKRGLSVYQQFAALQPEQLVIHDEYIKLSANLGIAYFQKGVYREVLHITFNHKFHLILILSGYSRS
jgi:tetratricopeptide (TPR) repeat protein